MKSNIKYRFIIVLIIYTLIQVCMFNTIISFASSTSQVIEDGTYIIKSAINDKYVLDVSAGSNANKTNVTLYQNNNTTHQQFKIKHIGNGYYQITAVHSGKSLDVEASGQKNETNVEQYGINNPISKNQKWKIQKNADGTYSFISECNSLYLDVYQAKAQNGTNIQMYQGHGKEAQKFELERIDKNNTAPETNTGNNNQVQGTRTIADGVYAIACGTSDNYVLDVEGGSKADCANIQIFEKQSAKRQRFKVEYLGDGTYKIIAQYSGKVLDVEKNGKVNETNVCQYTPKSAITDNEKWIIKDAGNGYYNIISKSSGLYLDLYGGIAANGNNIQIYQGHGKASQKFKFVTPLDVVSIIDTSKYPGYKEKISALMDAHPGWNFELLYTGLKFDQVISGEAALHSRNLVPKNYGGEWICPTCGTKLYDSGWYCASR